MLNRPTYIKPQLQRLTDFSTLLGRRLVYEILVNLSNDHVTRGLDFVFVYLNDLLVTSPEHKTHKKHLKIVFKRHAEYGIIIGSEKCQFGTTKLSFFWYYICSEGIAWTR